jgi:hypothetical protein
MARPRVHTEERRTTGLRLSASVHDALRAYNADTRIPMTFIIESAVIEYLTRLGYYDSESASHEGLGSE